MYKQDLSLNNFQGLICYKTQLTTNVIIFLFFRHLITTEKDAEICLKKMISEIDRRVGLEKDILSGKWNTQNRR